MKDKALVEAIWEELKKDPFFRFAITDLAKTPPDDNLLEAIKAVRTDWDSLMHRVIEGVIDGRID